MKEGCNIQQRCRELCLLGRGSEIPNEGRMQLTELLTQYLLQLRPMQKVELVRYRKWCEKRRSDELHRVSTTDVLGLEQEEGQRRNADSSALFILLVESVAWK